MEVPRREPGNQTKVSTEGRPASRLLPLLASAEVMIKAQCAAIRGLATAAGRNPTAVPSLDA